MEEKAKEKFRCFTFTHYKLSSIQQGIQPFHAGIELMLKYKEFDAFEYAKETGSEPPLELVEQGNKANALYEWARTHKTVVCKNGGDSETLDIMQMAFEEQNEYPWAGFNESESDMVGMLTTLAIIVPVEIYDEGVSLMKNRKLEQVHGNELHTIFNEHGVPFEYTDFEWQLMEWIRSCPLAR